MNALVINTMYVTRGDGSGEVNISWDSLDEADTYVIEYRTSGGKKSWKLADITSESICTLKGLKNRRTYAFRVAAVNSAKKGPWSVPVKKKVG
ncbi:MAG: fibronectin type III domain-containing protein [Ignavibacteria bacterium]|nr:fibronectin type III domain-containing protein [Ignavibacteria bacterium]